jgi:GT2 family glycosyltransferase
MHSIIITFSNERIDNLKQTIRFLKKEKIASESELVLVCQTNYNKKPKGFKSVRTINLNSDFYCRSKMCNLGVNESKGEIIILLDGDRVLEKNYFTNVCSEIKPNECITTGNHWQMTHPATDEEIENEKYEAIYNPKSVENKMHHRGSFSGNTVFLKSTYISVGGMDESYVNYGYQDIDFSRKMITQGMNMIFREEKELHLFHEKHSDWKIHTVQNGIKYCKKWNLPPENDLIKMGESIEINVMEEIDIMKKTREKIILL